MNILTAFGSVNWIAVLVAFVAYTVLGGVWFTALFGKAYAASLGRADAPREKPSALFIAGPAVCTLVVTVTTALLMAALEITTAGYAVVLALVVGVGYLVANTVNIAINPNMPRPFFYSLISGSYHLVGIVLTALILTAF
ncbi:DUF1761 domain-containing protein [Actinoplanes sp. NBRC 103695]|uniref:DUF1761 domain-containing protein n=1 Tax=Actinoplanes sp. NBRC 103695 TaxID=3032202 RepID=UPI0024A47C24|nr:DUF1761 domain-containing protein [Actinoplanes sp. NBRC 103695]GLY92866.1 hypothetical protein Acsp02_01220 [Actinoplanes sp. NBRC 103695]